jgi:hypothetical protein
MGVCPVHLKDNRPKRHRFDIKTWKKKCLADIPNQRHHGRNYKYKYKYKPACTIVRMHSIDMAAKKDDESLFTNIEFLRKKMGLDCSP